MRRDIRVVASWTASQDGAPSAIREAARRLLSRPKAPAKRVQAVERDRERKAAKRELRQAIRKDVRDYCVARSEGKCEVPGCIGEAAEMDHFWGRGKVADAVTNCWMTCVGCHLRKTRNQPTRLDWLSLWAEHVRRHEYVDEMRKVASRIVLEKAQAVERTRRAAS